MQTEELDSFFSCLSSWWHTPIGTFFFFLTTHYSHMHAHCAQGSGRGSRRWAVDWYECQDFLIDTCAVSRSFGFSCLLPFQNLRSSFCCINNERVDFYLVVSPYCLFCMYIIMFFTHFIWSWCNILITFCICKGCGDDKWLFLRLPHCTPWWPSWE